MDWNDFYFRCWAILVEHAGAPTGDEARDLFVQAMLREERPVQEYRFQGNLGFGGKFMRNDGMLYVQCYREDETPKRRTVLDKTNELLKLLTPEGGVHGSPLEHQRRVHFRAFGS